MSIELWRLDDNLQSNTNLRRYSAEMAGKLDFSFNEYDVLHKWTVENPSEFWASIWSHCGVVGDRDATPFVENVGKMPGARFFPGATLNYAENLLAHPGPGDAVVFRGEQGAELRMSWSQLREHVARLSSHMKDLGIKPGDRIAAILPNIPEAIVGALAAATIGATWSSCSPDFGIRGILDRLGQIEPRVLIAVDGYAYGGKTFSLAEKTSEALRQLPSVEHVLIVGFTGQVDKVLKQIPNKQPSGRKLSAEVWHQTIAARTETTPEFVRLPFDHPLYILFSSGTTGIPKCIVHSAGGILLKHLCEQQLHSDLKSGDRIFYFTTLGWMMWNWLVSGLSSGATLMLYDGNPFHPDGNVLWDYADQEHWTHFGTSAKYIDAMKKAGLKPKNTHDLSALRSIMSTGSPLVPESFDYVYANIKKDIHLASISGGTDICGCFVLGNPLLPVLRGEIQCAALGLDVDVVDDECRRVDSKKGELVCKTPFPSMPIGFWNDPDGARYRAAYFERFDNVWHHGDFAERTPSGGFIIHGRSDATLNPGGVRIGTTEIYRQVEQLEEVTESLAIGQDWQGDVRIVLFVVMKRGVKLDDKLTDNLKQRIRSGASPRHVPAKIIQVADIPRTKSGKITELAVRDVVHGRTVTNKEALANPEALDHFADLKALRS